MADLGERVNRLRDPATIKNAFLASSPYVLRKAFSNDAGIRRLIAAGEPVLALIAREVQEDGDLSDITLAAFAYIVENVNSSAAPSVLGGLFPKAVEKPGPFFVHFAAHAIRSGLNLSVKPHEMVYSPAELAETRTMLR